MAALLLIHVLAREINTDSAGAEGKTGKKSDHNHKAKLENKSQVANEAGTRAESEGRY